MKRNTLYSLLILPALLVAAVDLHLALAADPADWTPVVAPITAMPKGQTYGRWAVEWQQWAFGIPATVNPLTDTTGENCAQRQVDKVWFLAGSIVGPVERTCTVPAGRPLFVPLIYAGYGAFLNDSPNTRTAKYVRAMGSCTEPVVISVWIDGFKVRNPSRFFTGASGSQSPLFNLQLPPGNLWGYDEATVPQLLLSPTAEQGYYLFIQPLPSGAHTIRWTASGCTQDTAQSVTYNLTVK